MTLATPEQARDELAVRGLVEAWADAVTRRDPSVAPALFTEDAQWEVPGLETITGSAAVVSLLERLLVGYAFLVQLVHSTVVTLDGDRATARSTVTEWSRGPDGQGSHVVGVYRDSATRTAAGWRFTHRRFDFLYRGRTDLPGRVYAHPETPGDKA